MLAFLFQHLGRDSQEVFLIGPLCVMRSFGTSHSGQKDGGHSRYSPVAGVEGKEVGGSPSSTQGEGGCLPTQKAGCWTYSSSVLPLLLASPVCCPNTSHRYSELVEQNVAILLKLDGLSR